MYITATGMVCAVGLNAASACAAMRAGIANFVELPYHDNQGQPIVGAPVPGLSFDLKRADRLVELLSRAIADCLKDQTKNSFDRVPLLVGLAEPERPGGGAGLAPTIIAEVQEKTGKRYHPTKSRVFASGHTAGFEALREARHLIQLGHATACIVCGVDSFLNATTLLWLDHHDRLKTPANRDGVIPGEGASAVLVQLNPLASARTEMSGLGFGREAATILSEEPLLGLGLTDAARAALGEAGLGLHEMDVRLSDVTGELYGFKELPLVEARLMRVIRKQAQPLWHWSETIGDSGAAAGIAQLILMDHAFQKGYAPGQKAICLSSAVPGDRAVAILSEYH